eukprot:scaffold2783_cov129-Cylindrotheca_fusiformis.AAC.20
MGKEEFRLYHFFCVEFHAVCPVPVLRLPMLHLTKAHKARIEPMKTDEASRVEEKIVPEVPVNWDRCHAYMEQKRRFCRQRRQNGSSQYCGNHQHLEDNNACPRKRVPCPVDPSHMVFEDQVAKHVPICPATKKRKRQEGAEYFKENINTGGHGDICDNSSTSDKEHGKWAERIALRVLEIHQQVFAGETKIKPEKLTFKDIHDAIEMRDFSQGEIDSGIVESFQSHRIKSGGSRHIPQLASLLGHLRSIGVLPCADTEDRPNSEQPLLLLEMGAGRGMLGLTVAGAAATSSYSTHLMMIERAGTRGKAEKVLRNLGTAKDQQTSLQLENVQWSRIKCDLSHVCLPVLLETDEFKSTRVVVIAKHLCGVGTDFALKALEPIKHRVAACVFATCCHGVCSWSDYVGRDYLRMKMEDHARNISFGPKEFDLMRMWCAGSVACADSRDQHNLGTKPSNVDEEEAQAGHSMPGGEGPNSTNISKIVSALHLACGVQGLGRACQRLFDYGRQEYLRNVVFARAKHRGSTMVKLYHYVPLETTPQNAVLIAYGNR